MPNQNRESPVTRMDERCGSRSPARSQKTCIMTEPKPIRSDNVMSAPLCRMKITGEKYNHTEAVIPNQVRRLAAARLEVSLRTSRISAERGIPEAEYYPLVGVDRNVVNDALPELFVKGYGPKVSSSRKCCSMVTAIMDCIWHIRKEFCQPQSWSLSEWLLSQSLGRVFASSKLVVFR